MPFPLVRAKSAPLLGALPKSHGIGGIAGRRNVSWIPTAIKSIAQTGTLVLNSQTRKLIKDEAGSLWDKRPLNSFAIGGLLHSKFDSMTGAPRRKPSQGTLTDQIAQERISRLPGGSKIYIVGAHSSIAGSDALRGKIVWFVDHSMQVCDWTRDQLLKSGFQCQNKILYRRNEPNGIVTRVHVWTGNALSLLKTIDKVDLIVDSDAALRYSVSGSDVLKEYQAHLNLQGAVLGSVSAPGDQMTENMNPLFLWHLPDSAKVLGFTSITTGTHKSAGPKLDIFSRGPLKGSMSCVKQLYQDALYTQGGLERYTFKLKKC